MPEHSNHLEPLAFLVVVQLLSCVRLFATPWTTACQASLPFTIFWSLLKLTSIESVMPSNHLILHLPPSPPAINLSQLQGLFQWDGSSHRVAEVLKLQLQHQSFQWIFRVDFLKGWLVWSSLLTKRLSGVFSSTTVWKHHFFGAQPSLWSNSHIHIWLLENHSFDYMDLCQQMDVPAF